jgi:hypothetical protein
MLKPFVTLYQQREVSVIASNERMKDMRLSVHKDGSLD